MPLGLNDLVVSMWWFYDGFGKKCMYGIEGFVLVKIDNIMTLPGLWKTCFLRPFLPWLLSACVVI